MRKTCWLWPLLLTLATTSSLAEHAPDPELKPPHGRQATAWIGPALLDPEREGIGTLIGDVPVRDAAGAEHPLFALTGNHATVIVIRDRGCPVSLRYGPRILQFQDTYTPRGVRFLYLNLDPSDAAEVAADARFFTPGTYLVGAESELARALGVRSTGDVFVLDAQKRLVYRGAVDDQYGLGYTAAVPTRHFLRDALDAVLQGKAVEVPATAAPGCLIDADPRQPNPLEWLPFGEVTS